MAGVALAALALLAWRAAGIERRAHRLLLIDGRAVHWSGGRGLVVTSGGVLLEIAGDAVQQLPVSGERPILDGVSAGGGGAWLVDRAGAILHRDADGAVTERGRVAFDIPAISDAGGAGGAGGGVWVTRSPMQFSFNPDTAGAPLALRLSATWQPIGRADGMRIPSNPFLAQLANAAHVFAMPDGGAVIAPFVRDEVLRVGPDGAVRWRTERALAHQTPDPSMAVDRASGRAEVLVDYTPVNLALTAGPDGTLYVLSTVAARTDSSRLDALDPETGVVLATRRYGTALPTLTVGPGGIVREVDAAGLRRRDTRPDERQAFDAFALASPDGDSLRLTDLRGRVTVVNFWASWCLPCRTEMPALDSLAATFDTARVVFAALTDDVSRRAAARFLAEHPVPHLRVAWGDGRLKPRYRFLGLPATALVDAQGRLVRWWIGYVGPRQLDDLAGLIRSELGAPPADTGTLAVHRHH